MTLRTHDKHLALAFTVLALVVVFSGISTEDGSDAATYTYTLSYNANGGSGAPSMQTATSDSDISYRFTISNTVPTYSGHTFLGWSRSATATTASFQPGGTINVSASIDARNCILYAVWQDSSVTDYTITIEMGNWDAYRYKIGSNSWSSYYVAQYPVSVPVGSYIRIEWTDSTFTYECTKLSNTLYGAGMTSTSPSQDSTYYPSSPLYTYTLIYNANGGSNAPGSTTAKSASSSYTFSISSSEPTRSNYTFLGWATSSSATTATYQPSGSYQVSTSSSNPTVSKTLYAVWQQTVTYTYTLSYNANGGTGAPAMQSATTTSSSSYTFTISNTVPTYSGHTFLGWSRSSQTDTPSYQPGDTINVTLLVDSRNCYLYAVWESTSYTYTLSYDANGGTGAPAMQSATTTNSSSYTFTISNTVPTYEGYVFQGWSRSSTQVIHLFQPGEDITVTVSIDNRSCVLFAIWDTEPVYTYTLSYDANGGTGAPAMQSATTTNSSSYTFTISDTTPTYEDHVFLGWSRSSQTDTPSYQPGDTINVTLLVDSRNCYLYAVWESSSYTYTLSYDANGGTGAPETQTVETTDSSSYTFTISDTIPTYEGFIFLGWSKSSTQVIHLFQPGDEIVVTVTQDNRNRVLYAIWSDSSGYTYTLSYDANGGTGAPPMQIATSASDVSYTFTISSIVPTKEDSRFMGWSRSPTGYGSFQPGGTINVSASIDSRNCILYAVWTTQDYTVWWDNSYVNGSANVAFDLTGPANSTIYKHSMQIPLLEYDGIEGDEDGIKYFSSTSMYLTIQVSFGKIDCSLYGPTGLMDSATFNSGTWRQFTIGIDAQSGKIDFMGTMGSGWNVGQTFTFENYQTVFTRTIFDFSQHASDLAFNQVYHKDIGTGTVHPKFQVSATTTFLDTYGFVMVDPHLNIYGAFPEYNDLRLNLYSFAIYGDTITINDWTFGMEGSKIADLYYILYKDESGKVHQTVVSPDVAGAAKYEATLTNIYVTWTNINSDDIDQRQCYLTFVNDNVTFELGTYARENLTISMEGVWYFTTALYEPYTAHETVYNMDWNNWFNLSGSAFIIAIIALLVILTVLFNIFYVPSMLDYAIIIGAGVVSFILIGGF